MEGATALATLASGGKRPQHHFITRIEDVTGVVRFERQPKVSQAITANAARQAAGLFTPFGPSRCYSGSTGSDRDAWLFRIGPSGATAIWIGFDEPKKICADSTLSKMLHGLAEGLAK